MDTFYRPKWTCGRYDEKTHSAIYYNLLSGTTYFFEDESADVVGRILSSGREGIISLPSISQLTGIDISSIISFFSQLVDLGLLLDTAPTESIITAERHLLSNHRKSSQQRQLLPSDPMQAVDAERDYLTRTRCKVFSLLIELTYECSAKCIHCYNPGASRNSKEQNTRHITGELELSDYKRIIDEFYEMGLVRVCLSGGDPFSKPIVWELMEYLYSKDIPFDLYTNGLRVIGKEARLANLFPCSVGISIYSDIPAVHDSITRIPGSLKKSLTVLENLAELSVPLAIKCCVMHNNVKSYRGVVRIADRYSATLQLECNIFDSVDGDKCVSKYLRLGREEMHIVLRDKDIPQYVGPEIENYGAHSMPKNENACAAGCTGFCLTPDGSLTYCVSFQASIGNLKSNSLTEILSNPELSWWRSRTLSDYEECGKYEYCKFCCLCPGLNFAATGTPLKPCDNNCFFAKMRSEVADSLQKGIDPLNGNSIDEALNLLPEYDTSDIMRIPSSNHYKTRLREASPNNIK